MRKVFATTPELNVSYGNEEAPRLCAHENCEEIGSYPAPKSPQQLRDYIWLCLDHVREYNKGWNYFADMDMAAIDEAINYATTWERPSWKFASGGMLRGRLTGDIDDLFGFDWSQTSQPPETKVLSDEERTAWKELGLTPCEDWQKIKNRYKRLVKKHHPDANGGSRANEEKLKLITRAFSVLKKSHDALR